MFNVRLAGGHLYGKQLFTWLSLVVSLMASFVLSFFPLDVLDVIWDLIESVSEGFLTYFCLREVKCSFPRGLLFLFVPRGYKTFSYSTQLGVKNFLLINVEMPTIVGIATLMSKKNNILGLSEPEKCFISLYFFLLFDIFEHLKCHAQLS